MSNGCCPPPIPGCCPPAGPPTCSSFNIPGPPGVNAYTNVIANFAIPANTATPITVTVASSAPFVPGQYVIVSDSVDGRGTFTVQSLPSPTTITLLWANAAGDSVSGTVFNVANTPIMTGTGAPGLGGTNGINAFTLLTANVSVPGDLITPVTFTVANSQWVTVGQYIAVGNATDGVANFKVTAVPNPTQIVGTWINARGDSGSGTTLTVVNGSTVSPAGVGTTIGFHIGTTAPPYPTAGNVSNSGTSETPLMLFNVPGGVLANTGDSLLIEAVFVLASNGNSKTCKLYFGATAILTVGAAAQNGGALVMKARVVRVTPTTQRVYGYALITTGGSFSAVTSNETTAAETLSNIVVIKGAGTSGTGTGDVSQTEMITRYDPV